MKRPLKRRKKRTPAAYDPMAPAHRRARRRRVFGPTPCCVRCGISDPDVLTARIAYSLQLLLELKRPVHDLHGEHLVDGWQPDDLRAVIDRQELHLGTQGWPDAYTFGRGHSPRP